MGHRAFQDAGAALAVRRLDPHSLAETDRAAWSALADAAPGTNMFAAPWLQGASLAHFDPARAARLCVVEAPGIGWIGAIALEPARGIGRVPLAHLRSWSHANAFLGTPLVRAGHEHLFWSQFLRALDRRPGGVALLCRSLPADDAVWTGLHETATAERRPHRVLRSCARPAHHATGSFDDYWRTAVTPRRRRRLASLAAQLGTQVGPVEFRWCEPDEPLDPWLDAFLALEGSGWKGRKGSALAGDPRDQRLLHRCRPRGMGGRHLQDRASRRRGADARNDHLLPRSGARARLQVGL
jgi:CelD/BcsL family acetyltransferase involved in cellulose biosynthesis